MYIDISGTSWKSRAHIYELGKDIMWFSRTSEQSVRRRTNSISPRPMQLHWLGTNADGAQMLREQLTELI
jgi:hypothetical protein